MNKLLLLALCLFTLDLKAQQMDSLQLMKDIKELSSDTYQGRKPGTYGGRLAQYYLINRFKEIGLGGYTDDYRMAFLIKEKISKDLPDSVLHNYKYTVGANIIGYIKGSSAETIVLSAHFDHLGIINGAIYNGADDNASGTCALLALAAYFKANPPLHTLIFAAFDAEESVMLGSTAFIAKPPLSLDSILLNINMDMLGTSTFNQLYIGGTYYSPQFKPLLRRLITENSTELKINFGYDMPYSENNRVGRSDHAVFFVSNIPFLYFGVPEHVNYHQPTDDFDNISHSFYYKTANFILKSAIEIDKNFPVTRRTSK